MDDVAQAAELVQYVLQMLRAVERDDGKAESRDLRHKLLAKFDGIDLVTFRIDHRLVRMRLVITPRGEIEIIALRRDDEHVVAVYLEIGIKYIVIHIYIVLLSLQIIPFVIIPHQPVLQVKHRKRSGYLTLAYLIRLSLRVKAEKLPLELHELLLRLEPVPLVPAVLILGPDAVPVIRVHFHDVGPDEVERLFPDLIYFHGIGTIPERVPPLVRRRAAVPLRQ